MSADNKKVFDLDLERCVGCFACAVACMDQNDIDVEHEDAWREVVTVQSRHSLSGKLSYLSIACLHCDDAPCVIGCPTGALRKDAESNLVLAEPALCIGCHSCLMACPYGAPHFGADGKIRKCDGCAERVAHGLLPACVRICPTKALKYDTPENIARGKHKKMLQGMLKKQRGT